MRVFVSLFDRLLVCGLVGAVLMTTSMACFSEMRSIRCENDSDCFVREGEICHENRCARVRQEDAGADSDGDSTVLVGGQVTDSSTGQALRGVTICDGAGEESTSIQNDEGTYSIEIPVGTIKASHPDYFTGVAEVDTSAIIDFALDPCDETDCTDSPEPCP